MKTLLLFFSLLISLPVFSQNYRTVLVDKEVYYDFKDAENAFMFSERTIDILPSRIINTNNYQVNNNDTIIYHQFNQEFEITEQTVYDSINQTYVNCNFHYPLDTGFLGYKTILQTDGKDVFFNRFNDSIFINTNASLNDNWIFYEDSNYYYEATVSNISYDSFLGISDSIKTITLQAKDFFGNNISTPYDSLVIKISKHYGLIEGFNFFQFPNGVKMGLPSIYPPRFNRIKILGLIHLNVGIDNLTAAEIFNYDIGDVFHHKTTETLYFGHWFSSSCDESFYYDLMTITGKQFSNNGDSVYYNVDLESYALNCEIDSGDSTVAIFDTLFIGDTIIGYDISANNVINTKTLQRDSDSTLWTQSEDGNKKFFTQQIEPDWNISGCPIMFPFVRFFDTIYQRGLGISSSWILPDASSIGLEQIKHELVYYDKNGIIHGTPINIASLSSTDEFIKNDFEINLKLFPNPTNNRLNFQFTEPINNAEIRIYSSIGQLMTTQNVTDTNMQFQVSDWSKGIYFYGIYVEGEVVKQGQILIEN